MAKKVYVGLSGGVDSSVTAALLKEQGYDVTGVYMKNWSQDLPGFECPWKQDFTDAKRIAVQLGIPFKMYDFEKDYRQKVVDYMIEGYKAGRTPNPDIMCNQEIKFRLFLEAALEDGADYVATGHYARVVHQVRKVESPSSPEAVLMMAKDGNKDQTYFLYRVSEDALKKTLFPLGDYTKPEVRELAKKFGLVTAAKKESMGICFVGKVGIKEFLTHELGEQPAGEVGAGLPYYVVGKDMAKNEVYVTTDLNDERLWSKTLRLTDIHWINGAPQENKQIKVRTRHRAPLVAGTLDIASSSQKNGQNTLDIALSDEIRALTPGQSAVIYDGETVLGGGIII